MSRKTWLILGISAIALAAGVVVLYQLLLPAIMFNEIARSHIEGNVPEQKDFDQVLRRDLEKYFKSKYSDRISIKYEFLREGPTQTGIAYPKYYLWVTILDGKNKVDEGAIRVAAIEKERFEVTHFLKRSEINDNIYSIFPAPVSEIIKNKL